MARKGQKRPSFNPPQEGSDSSLLVFSCPKCGKAFLDKDHCPECEPPSGTPYLCSSCGRMHSVQDELNFKIKCPCGHIMSAERVEIKRREKKPAAPNPADPFPAGAVLFDASGIKYRIVSRDKVLTSMTNRFVLIVERMA